MGKGLAFPYDFGFFPSTLGADGDPLDVLLFLDAAVPAGSVATARLIGVHEVEQKDRGEPWERNDRFSQSPRMRICCRKRILLHSLCRAQWQKLRIVRRSGPRRALKLLKAGAKTFKATRLDHAVRTRADPSLAKMLPYFDARADYAWCGNFGGSTAATPSIGPVPGRKHCNAVLGYGGNGITFSMMPAQILRALTSRLQQNKGRSKAPLALQ